MNAPRFNLDFREFNSTLNKYQQLHKRRSAPNLVNKKALFIARRAIVETPRPEPTVIGRALSKIVYTFSNKGRKSFTTRKTFGGNGQVLEAPIAALIINFIRGKRGQKGLFGEDMKAAVARIVKARTQARAFLAAGWIPAVKKLSPLVSGKQGAAPEDKDARRIPDPHGDCKPAKSSGNVTVAKIINSAVAHFTTTQDPLGKIALPALQKAIDYETASMKQNIEDEMRKAAKECGIKTN